MLDELHIMLFTSFYEECLDKGESWFPVAPISLISDFFKSKGYTFLGHSDTNGWQIDFEYLFKKEVNTISLTGSLWYGDYKIKIQ